LAKVAGPLSSKDVRAAVLAVRLAVLVHHARTAMALPRITLSVARDIRFGISRRWLAAHPLTDYLLAKERAQWAELGYPWRMAGV
jgi:exopolyphosphatase/guanosine-5'-triphosphate,3'-diphosphate pyrophosphatase